MKGRQSRAFLPVALCLAVALSLLACSRTPPPSGPDIPDRYGNAIPFAQAWEVMSISAAEVLKDADWGVERARKCVALAPYWAQPVNDVLQPVEPALVQRVAERLEKAARVEVLVLDEAAAKDACPDKAMRQAVSFEQLNLWEGKLYVRVWERCAGDCWGGSDWEYEFARDGESWKLAARRSLRIA